MRQAERPIVIAIDGPAGSGKSSTAKAVAAQMGYRHLDSGAFYRTITLAALEAGIAAERWPSLTFEELRALGVESTPTEKGYALSIRGEPVGDRIRSPEVNANVSRMAAVPAVRDWLMEALRAAGRDGGLVADGRDIGTVVFPEADLKLFLVCDPPERARRRLKQEGKETADESTLEEEVQRLVARDRQDEGRETAPLVQAEDAVVLDTTALSFEGQVAEIARLAKSRISA